MSVATNSFSKLLSKASFRMYILYLLNNSRYFKKSGNILVEGYVQVKANKLYMSSTCLGILILIRFAILKALSKMNCQER